MKSNYPKNRNTNSSSRSKRTPLPSSSSSRTTKNRNNDTTHTISTTHSNTSSRSKGRNISTTATTPTSIFKKSGQKGAEAHTVPESTRIHFTQMLVSMREDDTVDKLELSPDLSNTERKFLHLLASQLGLKSKSIGKGDERRIIVSKMNGVSGGGVSGGSGKKGGDNDNNNNGPGDSNHGVDDSNIPCLPIPHPPQQHQQHQQQQPQQLEKNPILLLKYLQRHPPSAVELAESIETGSSLLKLGIDDDENDDDKKMQGEDNDFSLEKKNIIKEALMEIGGEELYGNSTGDDVRRNRRESVMSSSSSSNRKQDATTATNPNTAAAAAAAAQRARESHPDYPNRCEMRRKLPAHQYQEEICNVIRSKSVTILPGDTGCGKSTQVPQFILDSNPNCNIVVTQPRRISAISIAERVAWERCEQVGDVVGYNVRLDNAVSDKTQLLFVTPGVLLRKLQSSPDLLEFTHVIIDEIHERDKYTEFLMIVLRDIMSRRSRGRELRVVLMSATIQTNELKQYWNGIGTNVSTSGSGGGNDYGSVILGDFVTAATEPAEICIPGRTFPVQSFYLEDVLAMTGYVNHVHLDGELQDVEEALSNLFASRLGGTASTNAATTENAWLSKGKGRTGKKKKQGRQVDDSQEQETVVVSDHSFVCIMCNRGGFKCAEELGSHMGICNGGGDLDMVALEKKVRNIKVCTEFGSKLEGGVTDGNDDDETEAVIFEDEIEDENEKLQENTDDYDDDDDDERFGMHAGKWDGESPFAVADVVESSLKTTLTEEEMLNRYHLMHDDEQVDSALIMETIKYIDRASYLDGAILVFLPGWQEISELTILLESTHPFADKNKFSVLPLHSGIPSKDQRLVFQRPRQGVRKIVLSTNIAETSVTIDDVAFVIDSGRAKEKNYDPHLQTSTLQPMWISKASAKQRRGRAGRTKPGVCFHLFSRRRFASFREFLESELLRTSLEEICLQCKKLNLTPGGPDDDDGIPAFLSAALTPPHPKSVTNALDKLVEIGAMEVEMNDLTRLGHCLSCLSVSPEVGKMVIWSYILGCSKSASSMAVAMSYKSPFIIPPPHMSTNADKARVEISQGTESDQVTILKVLQARDNFVKRNRTDQLNAYCRSKFINVATLQMIADLRRNISRELVAIGFPDPTHSSNSNAWYNRNETSSTTITTSTPNLPFLQSTVVAGVYPNVACRQAESTKFTNNTKRSLKIHFGSINACKGQPLSKKSSSLEFIAYGEMVKGKTMYTLNQTTHLSSVIPILLLCGNFRVRPYRGGSVDSTPEEKCNSMSVVSVDDWICFKCDQQFASSLAILRKRLNSMFHHFVSHPKTFYTGLSDMERDTLTVLDELLRSTHHLRRL